MNAESTLVSMCCGAAAIPLGFAAWSWLTGNRNGSDVEPAPQDNVVRSDTPGHPEYATQEAARITNRIRKMHDGDLDVYVNSDPEHADWHSQQRHIEWMLEGGRAARNGVHVHQTDWQTRDRMGAGGTSHVWHNTAETDDTGTTITHSITRSGGDGWKLVAGIICLAITLGPAIVCIILLAQR